ncbi:MAG TPA: hypothetical protein VN924_11985 [Bryobacteraceae bacterium]|nr:hypothetical protein [Bryobacteraceae bacterium]
MRNRSRHFLGAALYVLPLRAAAGTLLFAAHAAAIRVRDLAEAASRAAGADGEVENVPIEEARATMGPFADALALDQQISGKLAEPLLNWRPNRPPYSKSWRAACILSGSGSRSTLAAPPVAVER